jgi:hypothetical protein
MIILLLYLFTGWFLVSLTINLTNFILNKLFKTISNKLMILSILINGFFWIIIFGMIPYDLLNESMNVYCTDGTEKESNPYMVTLSSEHFNKSCNDFKPIDTPQSPSNSDWSINNPYESSSLDLNILLSTLESTDSLEKIMESLLILSMVSFTLTLYVLITVILNLKDFTKVKWLNDNPKLLKFIERIKVARTSVVIPILLLLLFISLISYYGLYSVLKALLIYKSSIM